jgi:Icc-related predicted phosphoesterase
MRVAAVADIHSPKHLDLFQQALAGLGECDLLLLVGDMVLKNDHTQLPVVLATARKFYGGQILACFGNEEYEQSVEEYKSSRELTWIDDRAVTLEVGDLKVGVIGSRGSLDRPTFWQRTHVKGVAETYRRRVETVDRLLAELRADVKIVMTHYAPTYVTLEGERESAWPEVACRAFQSIIERRQPDVWFHGHAHQSRKSEVEMGKTLVANASLPSRRKITVIELPRKVGLERFF